VRILLLGPQGSGKGTQAKRLADEYGLVHISTGDMLRAAIDEGSDLGEQVQGIVESGALVPDDLIVEIMRRRLSANGAANGFILDGFPRTMAQADALDAMLRDIGQPLDVVFELQLSDEECLKRMQQRAQDEGRADDTPETMAKRLEIYHAETEPLVEHYRARGNLVGIHAERAIPEVFAELQETIEQAGARA
jgi:adenylate kinase